MFWIKFSTFRFVEELIVVLTWTDPGPGSGSYPGPGSVSKVLVAPAGPGGERGPGDGRHAAGGHLWCSQWARQGEVYRPHQGKTVVLQFCSGSDRFLTQGSNTGGVSSEHAPELQTEWVLGGPTARRVHLAARLVCGEWRLCRIHCRNRTGPELYPTEPMNQLTVGVLFTYRFLQPPPDRTLMPPERSCRSWGREKDPWPRRSSPRWSRSWRRE